MESVRSDHGQKLSVHVGGELEVRSHGDTELEPKTGGCPTPCGTYRGECEKLSWKGKIYVF